MRNSGRIIFIGIIAISAFFRAYNADNGYDGPFRGPKYSLTTPETWQTQNNPEGLDFLACSPEVEGEDTFTALSILKENVHKSWSDEKYIKAATDSIIKEVDVKSKIAFKTAKVGAVDGYLATYIFMLDGITFKNDTYIVIDDSNAAYAINILCAVDLYDKYKPQMDEIVSTFKLIK